MTSFEYALGLFSVLMALALGDIAINVHKLIRHWRTIRWDGRVIVSALLVVVVIVRMWFALWAIRDDGLVLVFPFYLSLFIELMILFLLAAHCLPDEPSADCDLGAFYEANSRSLWSIFALFQLSFFLHWLYFGGRAQPASAWAGLLAVLGLYVLLARVRWNWLHLAVPIALIAYEIWRNWDRTLGERIAA
jgi:hypothetical protein